MSKKKPACDIKPNLLTSYSQLKDLNNRAFQFAETLTNHFKSYVESSKGKNTKKNIESINAVSRNLELFITTLTEHRATILPLQDQLCVTKDNNPTGIIFALYEEHSRYIDQSVTTLRKQIDELQSNE